MHGGVLIFAMVLLAINFELEKRLLYNICNGHIDHSSYNFTYLIHTQSETIACDFIS